MPNSHSIDITWIKIGIIAGPLYIGLYCSCHPGKVSSVKSGGKHCVY